MMCFPLGSNEVHAYGECYAPCQIILKLTGPTFEAASTFRDSFNPLIDTYEQLGETLPMRREYEKLLQRRDVMVRILTNICKDILDVHHAALRRFSGKGKKVF